MRTKSTQATRILAHTGHTATVSVQLWDPSGTAHTIRAEDILSVEITTGVEGPTTAKITLRRQYGRRSNVPIISPFIWGLAWRVLVSCTVMPEDISTGVTLTVFDGFIDAGAWSDDVMAIDATDKTAKLRDTWIERERVYGLCQGAAATKGAYVWKPGLYPVEGDLFVPSEAKRNGNFYMVSYVIAPGFQTASEPVWDTAAGSVSYGDGGDIEFTQVGVTSDTTGIAVETLLAQILADNGLSLQISTPVSPGWNVKPYLQQSQSVLDAVTAIVDQLGWTFRSVWNESANEFRLTLAEPPRTSTTSVRTFRRDEERDLSDAGANVFDIRNAIRVTFADSANVTPDGKPKRSTVDVSDGTSIAKYGRRFMAIQEADTSGIDTHYEADRLANAVLSDLKEPLMGVSYETGVDPWLQLDDLVTLPADGIRWAADQRLAIVGITHAFKSDGASTRLQLSGQPVAQVQGWLEIDARANDDGLAPTTLAQSGATSISITRTVGGMLISVVQSQLMLGSLDRSYEFHVSPNAGFTPSSATLVQSGTATSCVVSNLVPGKMYHVVVIPFATDGGRVVRGDPSDEVGFVAWQATIGCSDSTSTQSHLPLNGNFEHASDDLASAPPDHWRPEALSGEPVETWGPAGSVFYGTSTGTVGRFVTLRPSASQRGRIISSPFQVRPDARELNVYFGYRGTGVGAVNLEVVVRTYTDASLATEIDSVVFAVASPTYGDFYSAAHAFAISDGAGVNYATVELRRSSIGSTAVYFDVGYVYAEVAGDIHKLSVSTLVARQEGWQGLSFGSGWANYGGSWAAGQFFKDSLGVVHLRGLIKRTSGSGTLMFTLPSGYRPASGEIFTGMTSGGSPGDDTPGRFDLDTSGQMTLSLGQTAYVSLSGITFDTR